MKINTLKTKAFMALLAMLVSAFLTGNINAQSGTTGVKGTVKDQQGAVVPGATVKLNNLANGFSRTVTTSNEGNFNFPAILPGTYQIEVSANNFKKAVVRDVQALVDNPIEVNIGLEPGDVTAVVDVTSNNIESIVNT